MIGAQVWLGAHVTDGVLPLQASVVEHSDQSRKTVTLTLCQEARDGAKLAGTRGFGARDGRETFEMGMLLVMRLAQGRDQLRSCDPRKTM